MNIGDYIRSKYGIAKIIKETNDGYWCDGRIIFSSSYTSAKQNYLRKSSIKQYNIKSSPNIIDLIEVGDYVNGCPVLHKEKNELVCGLLLRYKEENIESIVTKEQFKSMEYKVGDKENE